MPKKKVIEDSDATPLEVKHEKSDFPKDLKVPCGCEWCGKPMAREPIFCDEDCKQSYEARH